MQEPGSPLRVLLDNEMQAAEEPVCEGRTTQGKEYDYYFILLYHKKIV